MQQESNTLNPEIVNNRNQSIDLIKILAMFGVIGLHVFIEYIDYPIVQIADNHIPIISIPLFFMVSGYLMTSKGTLEWNYVFKKIKNIFLFVTTISLSYYLLKFLVYNQKPSVFFLFQPYIQRGDLSKFWYFGAMMPIYLMAPYLVRIVKSKYLVSIIFIGALLLNGVFLLDFFYGFELHVIQSFRLYTFAFYFIVGGGISVHNWKSKIWLSLFALLLLELFVLITRYFYSGNDFFKVSFFYPSICCIIASFLVFTYCNSLSINNSKVIACLSKLFLPVYTIHPLLIYYFRPFDWAFFNGLGVVIEFLIVSLLSVLFSYLLMKVKLLSRIFTL